MKIDRLPAVFLALCLCLLFHAGPTQARETSNFSLKHPAGSVAHCFDGDTLKLSDRRVVRLAGIDTPELGKNGKKSQFYARQARRELEQLVRGKKIRLVPQSASTRDRYGRIVAEALLEDGQSINAQMIERGAAFFYPHEDLDAAFQEKLRKLQDEAIKERRGMWDELLASSIARNNYIGNRSSRRFFPEDCAEAQRIKPRNKVHFGNLMDAFLSGFAPARICPFWPDAL